MANRRFSLAGVLLLIAVATRPALADDAAANFATRLFIEACVPNMGQPDRIRAWAAQKQLPQISSPAALSVLVGAGPKGSAWYVPSALGRFALSIRGLTEACAVYAQQAGPAEIEALFRKLIEAVRRPGIEVSVVDDKETATAAGKTRVLAYQIRPPNGAKGFVFLLIAAQNPNGAFQASMQVAAAAF